MPAFFRAVSFFPALLFASTISAQGQGMPLRVEAVRLLEHANAVSRPPHVMPNRKQETTFRAYAPDGTSKDGTFDVIYTADSERYETIFGDYHAISIHLPDRIVQSKYVPPPPEASEVYTLTPIRLGRFDESDIIHSISLATLFGRPAKCIEFDTVTGRTRESNEICVDQELGSIVRWRIGEDLIENTDYFAFGGALLPVHIRYYIKGKLRMEIEQKFTLIDGPVDWGPLTPPNATILLGCAQYRRPIIQSAPQPESAGAGPWYDVKVHAEVGSDGHVRDATVLSTGRPDLEQQAMQIVSGWVFAPATCDGKPISIGTNLVVHFPPQ